MKTSKVLIFLFCLPTVLLFAQKTAVVNSGKSCDLTIAFDQCELAKNSSILITDNKAYAATQSVAIAQKDNLGKCFCSPSFSGDNCKQTLPKDYTTMTYNYKDQSSFDSRNYLKKGHTPKIKNIRIRQTTETGPGSYKIGGGFYNPFGIDVDCGPIRFDDGTGSSGSSWLISNNQVNFAAVFHATDKAIYLDFSALSPDGKVLWTEYTQLFETPKNEGVVVSVPAQAKNGGGGGIKITHAPTFYWPPIQSSGGKKKTINPNEGTTIFFPDEIVDDLRKGSAFEILTGNSATVENTLEKESLNYSNGQFTTDSPILKNNGNNGGIKITTVRPIKYPDDFTKPTNRAVQPIDGLGVIFFFETKSKNADNLLDLTEMEIQELLVSYDFSGDLKVEINKLLNGRSGFLIVR